MILAANGAYLVLTSLMGSTYQMTEMVCLALCAAVYFGCYQGSILQSSILAGNFADKYSSFWRKFPNKNNRYKLI
jgi:hypothetical protein